MTNLTFQTSEISELKLIMSDLLFLIRVGPLDLQKLIPKEVLRSKMNLDVKILDYDLLNGFIRYQLDFDFDDRVEHKQLSFRVAKVLDPTKQKVFFIGN